MTDLHFPRLHQNDDDTIRVMCPDLPDGTGRSFRVKRSSLSRSPTLAEFFKSSHYLDGCNMQLTFMSDPAVCFQIVQTYLDEGPDMYTKTRLRVYVTMNYRIADRFVVLVRLHSLAKKLALPSLMDMTYEAIVEGERLVTPSFCITIASVVFSKNAGFDKLLKDWCLKHIGYHFLALKNIREWCDALKVLEYELKEQWSKLLEANTAVLAAIEEQASEKAVERIISGMSTESQGNAISAIEREETTVEEFIKRVKEEEGRRSDDDWEELEFISEEDQTLTDTKAREMLGMTTPTKSKRPEKKETPKEFPITRSISVGSPETAKARAVMGLDGSIGRVSGRKHIKPNRTSKLLKLLN